MFQISKTADTTSIVRFTGYRKMTDLTAKLVIGSVTVDVPIVVSDFMTIPASAVEDVDPGRTEIKLVVKDGKGKVIVSQNIMTEIVDGEVGTQEILCFIPVVINLPSGGGGGGGAGGTDTRVDELLDGTLGLTKLKFVDGDGNEYEISAVTEEDYPTLQVRKIVG